MTRILVVDDDPHIRELVRVFLRREGFETAEAADGVEALARLESAGADLAVVDVMMPRMDGWALCRELRSTYEMPVLLLTAKGETPDKLRGFDLGADDYVVKPFDPGGAVHQRHGEGARRDGADAPAVHLRRVPRNPVAAHVHSRLRARAAERRRRPARSSAVFGHYRSGERTAVAP